MTRLAPALPPLAFLATFGLFFVDKTREAGTVLRSGRGLLAVAAVAVGYAAVSVVVRRAARQAWVASVVMAAAVLGLAAWIVRPYYTDRDVSRVLVAGPVEPAAPDGATTTAPPPATTAPPPATTTPPAAPATTDAPAPASTVPAPAATTASRPTPTTTAASAATVRVASGRLAGLGHDAEGTVSLLRTPEGRLVVRFEDFDIEGVPDPRLHLIEGQDVRRAGGTSLGGLPGNRGAVLDVAVPDGVDAGAGWTLLVWCRAFSVPVANATLT